MALSPFQQSLKDQHLSIGGVWTPNWEAILDRDPAYFAAYLQLRAVPVKNRHLPPKIQELILLSTDASCSHLFLPGIKLHTENALKAGASPAEVMEVLELTSVLGIHTTIVGAPLLLEVLEEEGKIEKGEMEKPLDERREKLKAEFMRKRGYWSESWESVIRLDPDFFEAYTAFSGVPFENGGVLSPKVKELVFCAIDCATTHLYVPGLKVHIRNAVRYGATKEEVMEVFELASLMGTQTVLLGAPVLKEAVERKS